jgi:hypothetical protein
MGVVSMSLTDWRKWATPDRRFPVRLFTPFMIKFRY